MILEYNLSPYLVRAGTPLKEALQQLDREKLRMLLCADDDGRLVGALTPGDLNRWLISEGSDSLDVDVAYVVNPRPRVRRVDAGSAEIAAELERVNFLPLVDERHHLRAVALRRELRRGIRIGERLVDEGRSAFVIAEIGNNHNGSLEEALRLIDLAVEAGADCAKFQMRDMAALYGDVTSDDTAENLGSQYTLDLLRRFQLSDDDLFRAFDHCRARGLEPLCTPWDAVSVDTLERYGMAAYKVASADLTNHELLRVLARTGKPLICSTGMSAEAEIHQSVELLKRWGAQFILLHCNSTYPTPFKDVNLAYMDRLRETGDCLVGYSGHERDLFVAVAAVARGAVVVEKHFTRDRDQEGNDHKVSLLPDEFARMVEGIRQTEAALGQRASRAISQGEMMNRVTLAKSVFCVRPLEVGEIIQREHLEIRSPGHGLQPNRMEELVGVPAPRTVAAGDVFYPEDVDGTGEAPREFALRGRWGLPVRHHDYRGLARLTNPRILEFHLSYRDVELDHETFFPERVDADLVVHAPELFAGDHTLDLASPDAAYRERSIAEMRRVIETTRRLAPFFVNADGAIGIVTNVGGFSMDAPLSPHAVAERRTLLLESLGQLQDPAVEIWPQTMPPYPWHFGGQQFHNMFLDAEWIDVFCRETGMRICLDVSHSMLACTHGAKRLEDFLEWVLPHTAHLHLADAAGVDGEGLQIGEGEVDFSVLAGAMTRLAPKASWIPEIWQGHERDGAGFWRALSKLERHGF